MKAMIFEASQEPLKLTELEEPLPGEDEVLIDVHVCGVCRTDLHIIDGDLDKPKTPLILGHEIVGTVLARGSLVTDIEIGQRVGVPWLANTCQTCQFCIAGKENLCDRAIFTGYTRDGGYATRTVANQKYCFKLADGMSDESIAPLLCAGLIGWRTLKLAGDGKNLGIYGFGAAAHIITQIAVKQGRNVFAFTREGDVAAQSLASELGASWAGSSSEAAPALLDAALIFAPVGELVPLALKSSSKGANIVCGGIHMSDIPSFPYNLLWQERTLKSVANLTREDAIEFFSLLKGISIRTSVTRFALNEANEALSALRRGQFSGAAVLSCQSFA